MTGRDLIAYTLSNNLENEPVFEAGRFIGFLTESEVAVKLCVGVATVRSMFNFGLLKGMKIGDAIYVSGDMKIHYDRKE